MSATALSRIYGDANPALTYAIGGLGLVNGDTLSGALATAAGLTSAVGSYAITQGTLAATGNYALSYSGADLTVTARPLLVRATDVRKFFGEKEPEITFLVEGAGLVNGDTLLGSLTREPGEVTGIYGTLQGSLSNTNYNIQFVPGTFTIIPAPSVAKRSVSLKENWINLNKSHLNPQYSDIEFDHSIFSSEDKILNSICSMLSEGVCLANRN